VSFLITNRAGAAGFRQDSDRYWKKKTDDKIPGHHPVSQAVYSVLDDIPEVTEYYVTVSAIRTVHALKVYVSVENNSCSAERIMDKLQAHLRVRPEVVISGKDEIQKQLFSGKSRKAIRFIDRRINQ